MSDAEDKQPDAGKKPLIKDWPVGGIGIDLRPDTPPPRKSEDDEVRPYQGSSVSWNRDFD